MNKQKPNNIFRYYKYQRIDKNLLTSLAKSQLYFAHRSRLNDPFDCNVSIRDILDHLIQSKDKYKSQRLMKLRRDERALKIFDEKVDSLGICSFSLKRDETLMWSHYAAGHRGVCLRYEFEEEYLNNGSIFVGVASVDYEKKSISDWLYNNIDSYERNCDFFLVELAKRYLTAKAPSWEYEKECRIIRPQDGLFEIPYGALTKVIFGLQTSAEDCMLIRSVVDSYYKGVKYCKVERKKDGDSGIEVIPIGID